MVTGSCHQDDLGDVERRCEVAEGEREAEREQVVQDVQRDAGLQPADQDHDRARPSARRRTGRRTAGSSGAPWASANSRARCSSDRERPGNASERAERLHQVAAEGVLLPQRLQRRGQQDHDRRRDQGAGDLVGRAVDLVGVVRAAARPRSARRSAPRRRARGRRRRTATGSPAAPRPASAAAGRWTTRTTSQRDQGQRRQREVEVEHRGRRDRLEAAAASANRSANGPARPGSPPRPRAPAAAGSAGSRNADDDQQDARRAASTRRSSRCAAPAGSCAARGAGAAARASVAGAGRGAVTAGTGAVRPGRGHGQRLPGSRGCGVQAGQRLLPPEQLERLEQRRRDPAAGDRDPDRPEGVARLEAELLDELGAQRLVDRRRWSTPRRRRAPRGRAATTSSPCVVEHLGDVGLVVARPRRRTGSPSIGAASVSLLIRSWTSGIALVSSDALRRP